MLVILKKIKVGLPLGRKGKDCDVTRKTLTSRSINMAKTKLKSSQLKHAGSRSRRIVFSEAA